MDDPLTIEFCEGDGCLRLIPTPPLIAPVPGAPLLLPLQVVVELTEFRGQSGTIVNLAGLEHIRDVLEWVVSTLDQQADLPWDSWAGEPPQEASIYLDDEIVLNFSISRPGRFELGVKINRWEVPHSVQLSFLLVPDLGALPQAVDAARKALELFSATDASQ